MFLLSSKSSEYIGRVYVRMCQYSRIGLMWGHVENVYLSRQCVVDEKIKRTQNRKTNNNMNA